MAERTTSRRLWRGPASRAVGEMRPPQGRRRSFLYHMCANILKMCVLDEINTKKRQQKIVCAGKKARPNKIARGETYLTFFSPAPEEDFFFASEKTRIRFCFFLPTAKKEAAHEKRGGGLRGEKTGFTTKRCASATFHHLFDALVGDELTFWQWSRGLLIIASKSLTTHMHKNVLLRIVSDDQFYYCFLFFQRRPFEKNRWVVVRVSKAQHPPRSDQPRAFRSHSTQAQVTPCNVRVRIRAVGVLAGVSVRVWPHHHHACFS